MGHTTGSHRMNAVAEENRINAVGQSKGISSMIYINECFFFGNPEKKRESVFKFMPGLVITPP